MKNGPRYQRSQDYGLEMARIRLQRRLATKGLSNSDAISSFELVVYDVHMCCKFWKIGADGLTSFAGTRTMSEASFFAFSEKAMRYFDRFMWGRNPSRAGSSCPD